MMRHLLQRFRQDRRGVSAIEFAFIAPVLIAFYFGLAELSGALMADRKANQIAFENDDLVTEVTSISVSGSLADIWTVANTVMAPLPTTSLNMRVTELIADGTGKVTVALDANGKPESYISPKSTWLAYPAGSFTVPAGLISPSTCIILSEVQYTYTSPVHHFVPSWPIKQNFYFAPRQSTCISFTS